jgi:hypothetical protein
MTHPAFTHNMPRNVDDSIDLERVDTSDVINNEVIEAVLARAKRDCDERLEQLCIRALNGDRAGLEGVCAEIDDIQDRARKYYE